MNYDELVSEIERLKATQELLVSSLPRCSSRIFCKNIAIRQDPDGFYYCDKCSLKSYTDTPCADFIRNLEKELQKTKAVRDVRYPIAEFNLTKAKVVVTNNAPDMIREPDNGFDFKLEISDTAEKLHIVIEKARMFSWDTLRKEPG